MPYLFTTAPFESDSATTRAPSSARSPARLRPTVPNPWIATRVSGKRRPSFWSAVRMQLRTPRAVAPSRPTDPPTASGLPVTTPSTEWPTFIE